MVVFSKRALKIIEVSGHTTLGPLWHGDWQSGGSEFPPGCLAVHCREWELTVNPKPPTIKTAGGRTVGAAVRGGRVILYSSATAQTLW